MQTPADLPSLRHSRSPSNPATPCLLHGHSNICQPLNLCYFQLHHSSDPLVQVLESRSGDMQRQLLMAQSDLKAAKEGAHMQEMAKAQLEAQLAGVWWTVLLAFATAFCDVGCPSFTSSAIKQGAMYCLMLRQGQHVQCHSFGASCAVLCLSSNRISSLTKSLLYGICLRVVI